MNDWLTIAEGDAPVIVAFPHVGTDLADVGDGFRSPWLARRDADWWVDDLYAFVADMGVTTVRTGISRSVIDVNRDPSGASLYPGQATTELCPTTTFDGEPLYRDAGPDAGEIARRRTRWFDPYHAALAAQIDRLRARHETVVLYDAHSIRSHVPRLFADELPQFNVGTNGGTTCASRLSDAVMAACRASGDSHVLDGRFKGGWTTRHYGRPEGGVHAIQMELAIRGYMPEPATPDEANWPSHIDADHAAPLVRTLRHIMEAACAFAAKGNTPS